MTRVLQRLLVTTFLLLAATGCRSGKTVQAAQTMTNPQQLFAGRFSLELPGPISGGFSAQDFHSVSITWQDLNYLAGQDNSGKASNKLEIAWKRFVDNVSKDCPEVKPRVYQLRGRNAVFYKFTTTPTSPYVLVTWTPVGDKILQTSFTGPGDQFAGIESDTSYVLDRLVLHIPEAPAPGDFYIQDAIIHSSPNQGEGIAAEYRIGDGYDLSLTTDTVSVPFDVPVLKEARSAGPLSGFRAKVVRANRRTVLNMDGEEAVYFESDQAANTRDKGSFRAVFAYGGATKDAYRPHFILTLTRSNTASPPIDSARFTATWDSILNRLQVRPA